MESTPETFFREGVVFLSLSADELYRTSGDDLSSGIPQQIANGVQEGVEDGRDKVLKGEVMTSHLRAAEGTVAGQRFDGLDQPAGVVAT